jgi:hypothetical protein
MYNSDTPLRAELPTSRQLLRSTILAAISALVLLVAVVLPAEYGIDPTGVGRVLGMTKMGDIKQQLAAEAAADAAATAQATKSPAYRIVWLGSGQCGRTGGQGSSCCRPERTGSSCCAEDRMARRNVRHADGVKERKSK